MIRGTVAGQASLRQSLRDAVIHLRLHFQALLAPIFLWGVVLAGSRPDGVTWVIFLAYHVFLYGGATAFNSVYDRDTGPVGGLRRPPPVTAFLLPFSLAVLIFGFAVCLVRPLTALVYGVILALALAYSHPSVRLKGRPIGSLLTIAVGQGILPFVAGWLAMPTPVGQWTVATLGAVASAFVAISFYPLTQLYQIDEDRLRGDRTVTVAFGVARCFVLAAVLLALAAVFTTVVIAQRFGGGEAALVAVFYAGLFVGVQWWRQRFRRWDALQNFHAAMAFMVVGSSGFGLYLLAHLVEAYVLRASA